MTRVCSHCGQPILAAPADLQLLLAMLPLPPKERLLVNTLLEDYPREVSSAELVGVMWGADSYQPEPEEPEKILHSHTSKLRKKLVQFGWTIDGARFGGLRLIQIDKARRGYRERAEQMKAGEPTMAPRLVEYRGERRLLSEIARGSPIAYTAIYRRIFDLGWDVERALTQPIGTNGPKRAKSRPVTLTASEPIHALKGWS